MSINVQCRCGKQYVLDDSKAGMTLRCKECGAPIVVPGDEGGFDDELDEMDEEDFSRRSPTGSRRGRQPSASGANTVLYVVLGIVGGLFLLVVITCGGCWFVANRAVNEVQKKMDDPEFKKGLEEFKKQIDEEQKEARQKALKGGAPKDATSTPDPNVPPKTEPGQPSPTSSEKSGSAPPTNPNDPPKTEPAEPAEKK